MVQSKLKAPIFKESLYNKAFIINYRLSLYSMLINGRHKEFFKYGRGMTKYYGFNNSDAMFGSKGGFR